MILAAWAATEFVPLLWGFLNVVLWGVFFGVSFRLLSFPSPLPVKNLLASDALLVVP